MRFTKREWEQIRTAIESINQEEEPVKPDQEFYVGQIVAAIPNVSLFQHFYQITEIKGEKIWNITKDDSGGWSSKRHLRPATEEEIDEWYTCELEEEQVRAYEENSGNIRLVWSNGRWDILLTNKPNQARAFCKGVNIPIMSQEESKGEYKPPKGK